VRLVRAAVAAVLLAQAGLAVAVAQGCAWAAMLRSGQTLTQVVSGEKPCGLCLRIRAAKAPAVVAAAVSETDRAPAPASPSIALAPASLPLSPFCAAVPATSSPAVEPPPPRLLPS